MAGGGGEGQVNFYPYKKGGGGKSFICAEGGGGTKSFEVILMWDLEVLAIVMGGGRKKFRPPIFSFCSLPSP